MSCCSEQTLLPGQAGELINQLYELPDTISEKAGQRYDICKNCEHTTWLSKEELYEYLMTKIIESTKTKTDLLIIPALPKMPCAENRKLICCITKQPIFIKARIESESCPLDKWQLKL